MSPLRSLGMYVCVCVCLPVQSDNKQDSVLALIIKANTYRMFLTDHLKILAYIKIGCCQTMK